MPQACNFIKKETVAQVFSCEFCEISKNTFVYGVPSFSGKRDNFFLSSTLFRKWDYHRYFKVPKYASGTEPWYCLYFNLKGVMNRLSFLLKITMITEKQKLARNQFLSV